MSRRSDTLGRWRTRYYRLLSGTRLECFELHTGSGDGGTLTLHSVIDLHQVRNVRLCSKRSGGVLRKPRACTLSKPSTIFELVQGGRTKEFDAHEGGNAIAWVEALTRELQACNIGSPPLATRTLTPPAMMKSQSAIL
uniref:PH domain-containing protein n=1 Tax=Calcidiscus leptoporus TaxID=127549 RepID=A0A7S0P568_9EUKA